MAFYARLAHGSQAELVKQLQSELLISNERAVAAMMAVDRADFVVDKSEAYVDAPMRIGEQQTISAPHMHAMCLELLSDQLNKGAHVLDVGCGSGYLSAAMAHMVGDDGVVVAIDRVPELVQRTRDNIAKSHGKLVDDKCLIIMHADGWQGCEQHAPYDAIHVGAAAKRVPDKLIEQLKVGGRLIIPVGRTHEAQALYSIDKSEDGLVKKQVCGVRYVPLVEGLRDAR
jgi:protein-L-isoaspartate(D-aspartate) O-methyltransferase